MPRLGDRTAACRARAWAGALAVGAAALAGCTTGTDPAEGGAGGVSTDGSGVSGGSASATAAGPTTQGGIPQVSRDGFEPLTVHLVTPVWSAPPGSSGVRFGCQDLLVPVQTVPAETEDRLDTAIDFLMADARGSHGDPALANALSATRQTLTYTGHHREGDTEVLAFSGTVTVASTCESERVRAQLVGTAEAATDAADVRITVDGQDLDEVLALQPLEFGEEYTAAPAESAAADTTG
jgi:hypothetical protein